MKSHRKNNNIVFGRNLRKYFTYELILIRTSAALIPTRNPVLKLRDLYDNVHNMFDHECKNGILYENIILYVINR